MSMTKRTQGRPPRDSGINGREKLIEATRTYLRSNRKINLTRSEIAHGCGVTPALISYYFKDKRSLLDAVTKPLIAFYRAKLTEILEGGRPTSVQLRQVVRLFVELNRDNPFLVDYMLRELATEGLSDADRQALDQFHEAISQLVRSMMASGMWRQSDPTLAELALWGMCKAFGEDARRPDASPDHDQPHGDLIDARVDYIMHAFSAGGGRSCPAEVTTTTEHRSV